MNFIKKCLAYPGTYGLDLDDPNLTEIRREIIENKLFLNKVYHCFYKTIIKYSTGVPDGVVLEIGSGAGFLSQMKQDTITSDVMVLSGVDLVMSGLALPFKAHSVSTIYMINVFHHLPDSELFISEISKALKPGGRLIMIEPYCSIVSRLVFKYLHHEPIDMNADWKLSGSGPLSDANSALPWIVFQRDRKIFNSKFPNLEIKIIKPMMSLTYLLSGGVSFRSFMPGFTYPFFAALEWLLTPVQRYTGMFAVLVIERKKSQ